jgi:DNA-binding LacI/PurR family transcriptional regulator
LILEEVFPNPGARSLDPQDLNTLYPTVEGIRFNFVLSANTAATSNSDEASNQIDRELLKFIRSQSDLIITTGKTARSENLKASKFAPMLILTRSSDELNVPAVEPNDAKPVYVSQRLGTIYQSDKAIAIGGIQDSLPEFVESFSRANNLKHLVLESGLETARVFSSSGALKEADLTVTKAASQAEAEAVAEEFLNLIQFSDAILIQILQSQGTWFFRYGAA